VRLIFIWSIVYSILYADIGFEKNRLEQAWEYLNKNKTQKAIEIYESLSKNNVGEAYYNLGMIYGFGINGIQKNKNLAISYLRKATEYNHPKAKYHLAILLKEHAKSNKKEIIQLILESAMSGYDEAEIAFGKLLLDINKTDDAKQWFEKASKQGNIKAKEFLKQLKN